MQLNLNASLALDSRGLEALKMQARQDPQAALKGVSQQFEAVFLQTLLKSMRQALPGGGLLDSDQTRTYVSMLDQQMAQSLSAKGIGLADVMLRQLAHGQAPLDRVGPMPEAQPGEPGAASFETSLLPLVSKWLQFKAEVSTQAPMAPVVPAGATAKAAADRGQDFLKRMEEHAIQASQATGIPVKFLLGQAALESGWGKHEIRGADNSPSHNLFGVKAGRGWKGAGIDVMTTEYVDGVEHKLVQKFRAYGSYAEAFQDYARLMKANKRYAGLLGQTDGVAFAQGLQRAGYATDPNYADKLIQILNGSRMRQSLLA